MEQQVCSPWYPLSSWPADRFADLDPTQEYSKAQLAHYAPDPEKHKRFLPRLSRKERGSYALPEVEEEFLEEVCIISVVVASVCVRAWSDGPGLRRAWVPARKACTMVCCHCVHHRGAPAPVPGQAQAYPRIPSNVPLYNLSDVVPEIYEMRSGEWEDDDVVYT